MNTAGRLANTKRSADSIKGDVSATPTLIAMNTRPQTTATLIAATMSRGVIGRARDRRVFQRVLFCPRPLREAQSSKTTTRRWRVGG